MLTPGEPTSHQHQNLSIPVSQDNNQPKVEHSPMNQNSDSNNSINCLAEAITRIATQQPPQAAAMLKQVSSNTLMFNGKNKGSEIFEDVYHSMFKMQPEMTERMKVNHFHAHFQKEAVQNLQKHHFIEQKNS